MLFLFFIKTAFNYIAIHSVLLLIGAQKANDK